MPPSNADGTVPQVDWTEGRGVGGGWVQKVNGDCSFLKNGEERNWWFNGEEDWDYLSVEAQVDVGLSGQGHGVGGPEVQAEAKI